MSSKKPFKKDRNPNIFLSSSLSNQPVLNRIGTPASSKKAFQKGCPPIVSFKTALKKSLKQTGWEPQSFPLKQPLKR